MGYGWGLGSRNQNLRRERRQDIKRPPHPWQTACPSSPATSGVRRAWGWVVRVQCLGWRVAGIWWERFGIRDQGSEFGVGVPGSGHGADGVRGSGFKGQVVGIRVRSLDRRVSGSEFEVQGLSCRMNGGECREGARSRPRARVQGSWFQGFGFRV